MVFAVALASAGTGFSTISLSVPETEGDATLTAAIVTGLVAGIADGGV